MHGWNSNGNSESNTVVRDAFLAVSDCNVIVVDWRDLANSMYNTAANGVPSVGQYLGNFLDWLINNGGGNWNNVHLVGFSLGAHVVGNAGRHSGRRASRITGQCGISVRNLLKLVKKHYNYISNLNAVHLFLSLSSKIKIISSKFSASSSCSEQ